MTQRMFLLQRSRFVLLLLLVIGSQLTAQKNFFTRCNAENVRLDAAEWQRWQYISSDAYAREATLVRTEDIRMAQENGKLAITFPGSGQRVTIEARYINEDAENGFSWAGLITDGATGFAAFIQKDRRIAGQITKDGDVYELLPLDENYQALVRKRIDGAGPTGCAAPPTLDGTPPNITSDPGHCDNEDDCSATLSVLCALTPEANTAIAQVWGAANSDLYITLGGVITNLVLMLSDVPNKTVRIKTVKLDSYPYGGTAGYSIELDRVLLPDNLLELRDVNQADVVVLLTNSRYSDAVGAFYEIGPGFDAGYCIVTVPAFGTFGYFAHELGHTLGCRHSKDIDPTLACEHAKSHLGVDPNQPGYGYYWRTINEVMMPFGDYVDFYFENDGLGAVLDNRGWIPHFSNPDVYYNGVRTGGDVTYNASILRSSICETADYYPEGELTIFPTMDSPACSAPTNFSVDIVPSAPGVPGQGPFTVTWEYNNSGIFTWPFPFTNPDFVIFGTGTTASLAYPPFCPVYWVKCLVTSADGVGVSKVMRINPGDNCAVCDQFANPDDRSKVPVAATTVQIFPNPVTDRLGIELPQPGQVKSLEIRNLQGQLIQPIPVAADGHYSIPTTGLPSGAYLLHVMETDGAVSSHKFVVMK